MGGGKVVLTLCLKAAKGKGSGRNTIRRLDGPATLKFDVMVQY